MAFGDDDRADAAMQRWADAMGARHIDAQAPDDDAHRPPYCAPCGGRHWGGPCEASAFATARDRVIELEAEVAALSKALTILGEAAAERVRERDEARADLRDCQSDYADCAERLVEAEAAAVEMARRVRWMASCMEGHAVDVARREAEAVIDRWAKGRPTMASNVWRGKINVDASLAADIVRLRAERDEARAAYDTVRGFYVEAQAAAVEVARDFVTANDAYNGPDGIPWTGVPNARAIVARWGEGEAGEPCPVCRGTGYCDSIGIPGTPGTDIRIPCDHCQEADDGDE